MLCVWLAPLSHLNHLKGAKMATVKEEQKMIIQFEPQRGPGHFERIDGNTLKWVPDDPVPFTVVATPHPPADSPP